MKARDVTVAPVITVKANASVRDVARLFLDRRISAGRYHFSHAHGLSSFSADLARDRHDRGPLRAVLSPVSNTITHRPLANLR